MNTQLNPQTNPAQTNAPLQAAGAAQPIGQVKVDVFNVGQDLNAIMDKMREEREGLTKTFDQIRKAVRLLADLYGSLKGVASTSDVNLSKFEEAGIDIGVVIKDKVAEQAKNVDVLAAKYGVKSNLAEQFTHYDDRHTGAEAKNELLEDIETKLMSTLYNQINDLRTKIEATGANPEVKTDPQSAQQPADQNQFTVDSTTQK
jgi:hypothetical protein